MAAAYSMSWTVSYIDLTNRFKEVYGTDIEWKKNEEKCLLATWLCRTDQITQLHYCCCTTEHFNNLKFMSVTFWRAVVYSLSRPNNITFEESKS